MVLFAGLGFACSDDQASPESSTCSFTAPTRLWTPPGDERPQLNGHLQDLFIVGDQLVFRWGRDIPVWRMYTGDLCGDEVVDLEAADDLVDRFMLAPTDEKGLIAYGYRKSDGVVVQLDRLEVDGNDAPAEIGAFDGEEFEWWFGGGRSVHFMSSRDPEAAYVPAAGLGARPFSMWRHSGDPADPLERLPGEFVNIVFPGGDDPARSGGPVLTLTEAGELRVYDLQGSQVAAIEQVRYAQLAPGNSRVVWQQMGDGAVESTFVRDLASGVDIELTANEHTAVSWARVDSQQRDVGTWQWIDDAYLGLVGPDHTLVAVHDAATGEAIEVPEHIGGMATTSEGYWLLLPSEADENVAALWNPRDGELFTWYRQPTSLPLFRLPQIDGDDWHYLLLDQGGFNRGSWWRIDRTTGAWTRELPIFGVPYVELDDGRFVTAIANDDQRLTRLAVVDPATAVYTTIAENVVHSFAYSPEHGLYYLDSEGADMGLWLAPLPESAARSGGLRRPGMRSGGRELADLDPHHHTFADFTRERAIR